MLFLNKGNIEMKMNATPVRGTKDYLPLEVEVRDYVRGKIEETYKAYGFQKW